MRDTARRAVSPIAASVFGSLMSALITALLASPAFSASFVLGGPGSASGIESRIALSSTQILSDVDHPTALPAAGTTRVSQSRISSTTTYTLSDAGFELAFEHQRRNTAPSAGSSIDLYFRPDSDVEYVVEGSYSALDAFGQQIRFSVILEDLSAASVLFGSFDYSENTPNEVFPLGQSGGEFSFVSGQTTGTLISGHDYALSVRAQLERDLADPDATVLGTGFVRLTFVPEPATAMLLGLGLAGLSLGRRRCAGRAS